MAHILVVDDSADARLLLRLMLETEGYAVSEAANGLAALQRLREGGIDLLITDGLMPEMDGFRLSFEVKHDPELATLPIIFYTASFADSADMQLARSMGADDYLLKPDDMDAVLPSIEQLLSSPPTPPAAEALTDDALATLFDAYSRRLERKLDTKVIELKDTRDARDSLRAVLDHLPLLIATFDTEGENDYLNRWALEFFGDRPGDRLKAGLASALQSDGADSVVPVLRALSESPHHAEFTVRLRRHDGQRRTIQLSVMPYRDTAGALLGLVAAGTDITEDEQHRELLQYLSEYDVLTDLPNRRVLDERFEKVLQEIGLGKTCALLFVEIEGLKDINDDFGHDIGDVVVAGIARLLVDRARPEDLVVRLCGDEFVVLAEDVGYEEISALADDIRASLAQSALIPTATERRVSVRVAINVIPDIQRDGQVDGIDEVARESKRRSRATVFSARSPVGTALAVSPELHEALENPTPHLTFTPVYSLLTGDMVRCAVSAAFDVGDARVTDEEVMADAMGLGLARRVGRAVFEAALETVASTDLSLSLRLSLADMFDATTFERIEIAAESFGVTPSRIAFKVPLQAMLRGSPPRTWLRAARRSRIGLILDCGECSIGQAAGIDLTSFMELQLPAEALGDVGTEPPQEFATLVGDSAEEGLLICAADVDSSEALQRARDLGVHHAQGAALGAASDDPAKLLRQVRFG